MDCPRCGRTAQEGVVYCGYCGWKIESDMRPPEQFSSKLSEFPSELAELVPLVTWKTAKANAELAKAVVGEAKGLAVPGMQGLVQAMLPFAKAAETVVPKSGRAARGTNVKRAPAPRKAARKGAGKKSARRTKGKSK